MTGFQEGDIHPQDCDDTKLYFRYKTTGFSLAVLKNRIISSHLEHATDCYDDGNKSFLTSTCFSRQMPIPSIASFTGKRSKSTNSFLAEKPIK